jgi:hypothetical protein
MEGFSDRQRQVLELADELLKAGRHPESTRWQSMWFALKRTSSRLAGLFAIFMVIAGVSAMIARGCFTEQSRT